MKGVPVQPAPPSPHTPPVPPAPPVGADVPNSWLAVRLLANGFDLALVKDCDQKLVVKEGFISEHDFADCPPNEFDAAYLSSVGISAKGIQRHLIRLQGELHGASKGTSPVPPTQVKYNTLHSFFGLIHRIMLVYVFVSVGFSCTGKSGWFCLAHKARQAFTSAS